jgi:hypothetical protein
MSLSGAPAWDPVGMELTARNALLAELMARTERSRAIEIDALGALLEGKSATTEDIVWLVDALEGHGRRLLASTSGNVADDLRRVLPVARDLRDERGRAPTAREIADHAKMDEAVVRRALLFARVLGR